MVIGSFCLILKEIGKVISMKLLLIYDTLD